jgi:hypothetical protein
MNDKKTELNSSKQVIVEVLENGRVNVKCRGSLKQAIAFLKALEKEMNNDMS